MSKPDESEPALPWAPRPLALGTELMVEVETEDGQGWVSAEVSMAHGGHQYTLLVHPIEDDDYALPARPAAGAAAGAAAAAEGAAAAAAAGAGQGSEDEEEDGEAPEMRVRILSDSLLDILDSDGSEPEGGSMRCVWRPAPANLHEMFHHAVLAMAQRKLLPRGVELRSADDIAATLTQALTEVVTRAVNHTEEAGSKEVRVESVLAALEGLAKELGRPSLEARVRADIQELLQKQEQQERQQLEQQQQPAAPQQQQQQQGEGKGEEQDGRQPEKKARRSL